MSLTLAKIEELAPDQGSLDAARKLLKGSGWPLLGGDGAGMLWGECQGSGSQPYRVILSEPDLGYKCTCPSRKFPCKHVLAVMWMRVDGRAFATTARPAWVEDWVGRRRGPSATRAPAAGGTADAAQTGGAKADLAEAAEPPPDPKAEARAAAQRERNQAERHAAILAGLDELDLWLVDQLERGLAGFQAGALDQCRTLARRLVDAKAPGLAGRVEQIPTTLFALPETARIDFLISELGQLHLMAEAYRRQDRLTEALRADIRLAVGWTLTREALLADPLAQHLKSSWMVLATVNEVQPDKLRRLETWLCRLGDGEGSRFAVLIDFMPVSLGTVKNTYAPGEVFDAAVVFYPAGAPLRAVITEQAGGAVRGARWTPAPEDLPTALDRYDAALAARPWLGAWPLAVQGGVVCRSEAGIVLASAGAALPIEAKDTDPLLPLIGIGPIDAFGLWDGRSFDLKYAETPLGCWIGEAA